MNLCLKLPRRYLSLISLEKDEEIKYCSPYDILCDGTFGIGYVAVTDKRLFTFESGKLTEEVLLDSLRGVSSESAVGTGMMVLHGAAGKRLALRYTMRHATRLSYIARNADALIKGGIEVESRENDKNCPKCGRRLPGTKNCPHCSGKFSGFKKMWRLASSYVPRLILISLFMILGSVVTILSPEVQKRFIDGTLRSGQGDMADVIIFVVTMLAIALATVGINVLRNWWCTSLGARISMDLRSQMYEKIQKLSLNFIGSRRPGEIMNRVVRDVDEIRRFLEDVFGNMLSTLFTMAAALIMLFTLNWKLTIISTFFVIPPIVLNRIFRRKTHQMFHAQWIKSDKLNSALQDVISGMRVVKSFGKEEKEAAKFDQSATELSVVQKKNETFWAIFFPMLTFVMGLGSYVITYFGGNSVLQGSMTVGELNQFVSYAAVLYGPLGWLTQLPRRIIRMNTSLERIYDVLDEEPDIIDHEDALDHKMQGNIEFQNVCFGYKSYDPVLTDISFKVKKGEMIGLVGASGSGKSTLINLLMRLYDADSGNILIDGVDIRNIRKESLHKEIGVVLQETFLFSGTIFNNIRYAKPDATYEEVIRAAKMANAHDFICRMPDGYNTYVGEHGYNLSGGERQRVAIARAILTRPSLLILDEATSNLDTESEFLIQQALERLTEGRTTFAIAHRLSTLRKADRIFVIDRQHIAEAGTHRELLEKKGIYYGLVMAQLQMQRSSAERQENLPKKC